MCVNPDSKLRGLDTCLGCPTGPIRLDRDPASRSHRVERITVEFSRRGIGPDASTQSSEAMKHQGMWSLASSMYLQPFPGVPYGIPLY